LITVFSLSPFPGYLSQAVTSVDMREEIEGFLGKNYIRWDSDVYVLKNTAEAEYVFVVVRKEPGGQCIFRFDTDLALQSKAVVDRRSNLHLVDAFNDFVVGHVIFDDLMEAPPDTVTLGSLGSEWDCPAFSYGSENYILYSGGTNINYTPYTNTWSSGSPKTAIIGSPSDRQLVGIGYDWKLSGIHPLVPGAPVFLFLHGREPDNDDEFLEIAWTPASDYSTSSLQDDFYSNYFVSSRVYRVRKWNSVYYTQKGVVAQTHDRGRYYLLTLDGQIIKDMRITGNDEEVPIDFDIDGEYYYLLDTNNLRLYKAAAGF
jgi:hypothetical protein